MEMPIDVIIKRLEFMKDHFSNSPAPEFSEVCHYAIAALKHATESKLAGALAECQVNEDRAEKIIEAFKRRMAT